MSSALVIVDYQNDFLPGGALGVPDGFACFQPLVRAGEAVDNVLLTRDYHPADHISFSHAPKFEDKSWPPHCIQGTYGADIYTPLRNQFPHAPIFSKGLDKDVEQYSGWAAKLSSGATLGEYLRIRGVNEIYVGGVALDYCVEVTVLDLFEHGYEPTLLLDATRPVSYIGGANTLVGMAHYDGVINFITVDEVFYD